VSLYNSSPYYWDLGYQIKAKGYSTLNASVALTPDNSKITVTIWGRNLTNSAHIQGEVSTNYADLTTYGPPQEVGVSLGYAF
jgi:hypothetical protein